MSAPPQDKSTTARTRKERKRAQWRLKSEAARVQSLMEKHRAKSKSDMSKTNALNLPHSEIGYIGLNTKEYTYISNKSELQRIARNPK
jgi:hypothetical protein